MCQSPEIQGICVIPHEFLTQFSCLTSLCFPQFGFAGLMVAVKDNTWPTRVVIFNEVMEIAIGLVEQAEEHLFAQEREEVLLNQEDFFHRCVKQLPLQRNIFELSPRDLSLMPQM